jgi:hypothetical protein
MEIKNKSSLSTGIKEKREKLRIKIWGFTFDAVEYNHNKNMVTPQKITSEQRKLPQSKKSKNPRSQSKNLVENKNPQDLS